MGLTALPFSQKRKDSWNNGRCFNFVPSVSCWLEERAWKRSSLVSLQPTSRHWVMAASHVSGNESRFAKSWELAT